MKNILNRTFKTALEIDVAIEKELDVEVVKYQIKEDGVYSNYIFTLADGREVEVQTKAVTIYDGERVSGYWIH